MALVCLYIGDGGWIFYTEMVMCMCMSTQAMVKCVQRTNSYIGATGISRSTHTPYAAHAPSSFPLHSARHEERTHETRQHQIIKPTHTGAHCTYHQVNTFALSEHSIGAGVHSTKGTRKEETRERENHEREKIKMNKYVMHDTHTHVFSLLIQYSIFLFRARWMSNAWDSAIGQDSVVRKGQRYRWIFCFFSSHFTSSSSALMQLIFGWIVVWSRMNFHVYVCCCTLLHWRNRGNMNL